MASESTLGRSDSKEVSGRGLCKTVSTFRCVVNNDGKRVKPGGPRGLRDGRRRRSWLGGGAPPQAHRLRHMTACPIHLASRSQELAGLIYKQKALTTRHSSSWKWLMDFGALLAFEETQAQLLEPEQIAHKLPSIWPQFFIPALPDRPQNPIMNTVRLMDSRRLREETFQRPGQESVLDPSKISNKDQEVPVERNQHGADVWCNALRCPRRTSVSRDPLTWTWMAQQVRRTMCYHGIHWDTLTKLSSLPLFSRSAQPTHSPQHGNGNFAKAYLMATLIHILLALILYIETLYPEPYTQQPWTCFNLCVLLSQGFHRRSMSGIQHHKHSYYAVSNMERKVNSSLNIWMKLSAKGDRFEKLSLPRS